MDIRKIAKTATFATIGLVLSVSGAFAFTAKSSAALNIRSGPGTGYDVVDALYKGEKVTVKKCTSSRKWCYIKHKGPDGWVSAKFLKKIGGSKPKHIIRDSDPEVTFGFQFKSNGSVFGFGFSTDDDYYIHEPTPRRARICFYEHAHFKGRKACVKAGSKDNRLSGFWNDRISSIKIIGDASVTVCKHKNYNGKCRTYDNSKSYVGNTLNDHISSFKSYRY